MSKKAEWIEQQINLHDKFTTKTDEAIYGIPRISCIRVRRKRQNLRRWVVCVCVCVCVCVYVCKVCVCVCKVCVCVCKVCVWCRFLRRGFVFRSVREVWSCLCMTHMKQTPWDATDTLSRPRDATRTSPRKGWGCTSASPLCLHRLIIGWLLPIKPISQI